MMDEEDYKKSIEMSSEVDVCTFCLHRPECDRRDDTEPHILEMQYLHCHEEVKKADYKDDDHWVNVITIEG